ncbi:peptidylprolyl isomerase [Diplocloster modestus]|nr:peptidylprolyl isomerase [Diplocloster modestus]
MKKKLLVAAILAAMTMFAAACGSDDTKGNSSTDNAGQSSEAEATPAGQDSGTGQSDSGEAKDGQTASTEDLGIDVEYQFEEPKAGDTIAELQVKDFGTIKIKLFPDVAPKAVENFVTHAKDGYFDGLTFHRVIHEFMIQGGDPNGDGTGGESIWGEPFEDEFSNSLYPWRGALCMANSGSNTNGSQFFIVQNEKYDESLVSEMESMEWPQEIIDKYKEKGGAPWLFGQHTVFGQVFEGLDVVDAIAEVETSEPGVKDKPVTDVIIEKVTTYVKE